MHAYCKETKSTIDPTGFLMKYFCVYNQDAWKFCLNFTLTQDLANQPSFEQPPQAALLALQQNFSFFALI